MKTTIIVLSLLLFFSLSSQAQKFSIGTSAGFGDSWLTIQNSPYSTKFNPSYSIGGKLVYNVSDNWDISADIRFSAEGGKVKGIDPLDNKHDYTYRANYLRLPLQANYLFGKTNNVFRPKLSFGPSVGLLVGGKTDLVVNGMKASSFSSKDIFKSFDFGLAGAAGFNYRLGGGKWLSAEINYYQGMTDIRKESTDGSFKNKNIGANVGIIFPLGKRKK